MNNTILNIKILYDTIGKAEKKIAEYILSNPSGLIPLSISELADNCGCSEATVVRFSRHMGFGGYQELKISLAKDGCFNSVNENITVDDPPEKVFTKVCDDIYCSLEKTKKEVDSSTLLAVCNTLLNAERILIFGLGNSAPIAMDMAHKFLRLGYDAVAYNDNHMQVIASAHLCKNCVAVGISHSGSSKDIISALKIARDNGATTIAITNKGKSPIYKVADLILKTVSDETNYSILGLNSRIAQLALIDAIYYYAVCHTGNSKEKTDKTAEALLDKKY